MLRKALHILADRKLRTIGAILMLCLAFCLMGAVPAFFTNIDEYMLEEDSRKYGLFHGIFYEVTDANLEKLEGNMFVEQIGVFYGSGEYTLAEAEEIIRLGGYDATAQSLARIQLTEGRMPEVPGEIALESNWIDKFEKAPVIGDMITIQMPSGDKEYTITGFTANYRRDWLQYDQGTSSDRLPSGLLCVEEAQELAQVQHAMLYVSQFSKQENPETVFKGIGDTVQKKSNSYFINRNVYKNRGLNKIFGIMQRILLILPPIIAMAAALFFAMRPQMEQYRKLANQMYAQGARHKDVLLLEVVWMALLMVPAILLSQLLGEGIFALCKHLTGIPWEPLGGLTVAIIAAVTTIITVVVYTRKSILPLQDASYTQRREGKVLVAMPIRKGLAYTFGKRRKYSNRSPAYWAAIATSLVFITLMCGFMELKEGNYRLNMQQTQRSMEAAVYTEEGKQTARYGKFAIWQGEYLDEQAVEALESMPGVAYMDKQYGGEIASLVFPAHYSAYAQEIKRVDNVPGSKAITDITVVPKRLEVTQRGYTVWVLDEELQQALQSQYPELDVAAQLAEGKCIMICPDLADSIEESKVHTNDIYAEGDTIRFGMLGSTVPVQEIGDRLDVFTYHEQTLEVSKVLQDHIWLDYGYGAYDSDVNVSAGVYVIVSEQTAQGLDFLDEIKGFKLYMKDDCTEQEYADAKAAVEAITDGVYGVESYFDRHTVQVKQVVKATVLFAAIVAAAGSALLLLCVWIMIYQRSRELYEPTYGLMFRMGVPDKLIFRSFIWEGLFYLKRVVTIMFPILTFGETYYVSAYQYGFGQLGKMLVDAVLLALRDMGLFVAACLPLILLAAVWYSRRLDRARCIAKSLQYEE